jgi:hypothetical protein
VVLCPPSTVRGFLVLARVAASCPAQANQGRASLAVLLLTDQPSANVLLGVSAQHVAQQEGSDDEKDDIGRSTFLEQWTGYAAANDPRSLPARLERHFFVPVHALETKSPQIGQGARIQARSGTLPRPRLMSCVQTFAKCASTTDIMANAGAAFPVSALGARRACQLQHVFFSADGEEVAGARTKKKDGKASGRFEDFLLYLPGVGRSKEWFHRLKSSLQAYSVASFSTATTASSTQKGRAISGSTLGRPTDSGTAHSSSQKLPMLSGACCKQQQACQKYR